MDIYWIQKELPKLIIRLSFFLLSVNRLFHQLQVYLWIDRLGEDGKE